ncbi:hypothetical protein J6590_073517 [Homalodisca vitripennis]|nr:hypothetical protein J6590_073517 [Homalodisca vitripennis]
MNNFTTTHTHDYRWPNTSCLVPRAEAPSGRCEGRLGECDQATSKPWCGRDPPSPPPCTEPPVCNDLVPLSVNSPPRPWCERGPIVPRVNPRIPSAPAQLKVRPEVCPEESSNSSKPWCDGDGREVEAHVVSARVGAAPQQDTSRYDQPNQYLRKLCDKYPRPTAVVTATPRDELMRRVYADRYRTTYQTDFCKNADDTARQLAQCDSDMYQGTVQKVQYGEGEYISCKCGCGCRVALPPNVSQHAGDGPRLRPLACRPAAVSHNVHFSCCTPKKSDVSRGEVVGPPEKIPPWASEYTDSIGRTGHLIMEQKLLYQKKKNS